ncbi:MAG: CaiB/BaiF CoA transferase family protein [Solirubrobacterales bacterium]
MPAGALEGLVVADFARVLAGPLCSQNLADLGADVIKVERAGSGDDTRQWGPPFVEEGSTYFLGLNRGKRSIELDLKDEGDLALARELCRRADVVLESFRPGTMDRLGLGYREVSAANPAVVYTSISAFGSGENVQDLPGYDLLVEAMSGFMSVTGEPDGRAMRPGTAIADLVCGLYATIGTLAALSERRESGRGQHVEVTLMASAFVMLLNLGSSFLNTGEVPTRTGNHHPSIAPYQTYATGDGDLAVAVGNDAIFGRFCEVIGQPGLPADERFADNAGRVRHRDELNAVIGPALQQQGTAEWAAAMTAAGVPAGPVNDVRTAYEFAAGLGLDPVVELDGVRSTRPPVSMDRTPVNPHGRPPRLGEHSDEIRAWLSS